LKHGGSIFDILKIQIVFMWQTPKTEKLTGIFEWKTILLGDFGKEVKPLIFSKFQLKNRR